MVRIWIAIAAIVVAVALVMVVWRMPSYETPQETALREQLELARKEGLATTAEEFAAKMPAVEPAENAALLYKKLDPLVRTRRDFLPWTRDLGAAKPSPKLLADAKKLLSEHAEGLRLVERAVTLPKCWFNREWEDGAATLMPEFADMKAAAMLLALRGSVAAAEGRHEAAVQDAKIMLGLANHAASEPTAISQASGEGIERLALRYLAEWSLRYRDPVYAQEIHRIVEAMRKPNVVEEFSGELYHVLSLIELTQTTEGLKKLGLSADDIPKVPALSGLVEPEQAKIDIVKALRKYLAALKGPVGGKLASLDAIQADLFGALLAFPQAARLYEMLGAGEHFLANRVEDWEARRLMYVAVHRALLSPTVPRTIRTDDLLSPFDKKPLKYSFDGKEMIVTVSGYGYEGKPSQLKIVATAPK